jgi:hypothetical protein
MNKVRKIGVTELRHKLKFVRDRVLAGDKYLCLFQKRIKGEIVQIPTETDLDPAVVHLNMQLFRDKLKECYITLEKDKKHPGFVICLYGRPWGIFRRPVASKNVEQG